MMDPFLHLTAHAAATAGVVVDKNGKEQQVALFCDQIAAKRGDSRKAAGLGKDVAGILFIIGGQRSRSAGGQDPLHPVQAEFLLQGVEQPYKILWGKEIIAA